MHKINALDGERLLAADIAFSGALPPGHSPSKPREFLNLPFCRYSEIYQSCLN
jgi:hypothetical protein